MNQGLIPRRYAKALYKYAAGLKADGRLYALMTTLAASFEQQPDLERVMSNPFVGAADKQALLMTASGADATTDTVYADFLKLLRQNNRLPLSRAIALAYCDLYRRMHHIYVVTVTSATPLEPDDAKRLKALIQQRLGASATMEYTQRVDPALIGGFTININNERLDASVANELEQMRLKLLSHI